MKFPKNKRIVNKKLYLEYYRDHPNCELCDGIGTPPHHIIFKSQRGSDTWENLITLCAEHHMLCHSKDAAYWKNECLLKKYPVSESDDMR